MSEIEWPKWVVPHASHIVRTTAANAPDHVSTPAWTGCHVNRVDGVVTVLVADAEEEARAIAQAVQSETHPTPAAAT